MKKEQRVKKDSEFQAVFKKGKSFGNRQFVIYFLKKDKQQAFRIGLSVGKKVGNAVVRNRVKRYVRQAFIELTPRLKCDFDFVIIARTPVADFSFKEVKSSLLHILKKTSLLKVK